MAAEEAVEAAEVAAGFHGKDLVERAFHPADKFDTHNGKGKGKKETWATACLRAVFRLLEPQDPEARVVRRADVKQLLTRYGRMDMVKSNNQYATDCAHNGWMEFDGTKPGTWHVTEKGLAQAKLLFDH
jgi:hypothetical protein